jgi:UDP-N-acetylmuramate dehydrogenase
MERKAEALSACRSTTSCGASGGAATQHSAFTIRGMEVIELNDVEILRNEPLARHTTFRVGGPVSYLARPLTEDGLTSLMREVRRLRIPCFMLGGGSNVLAPDEPWDVLAIQLSRCCSNIIPVEGVQCGSMRLRVGAGVSVARWLRYCIENGLGGVEPLVGIPGTVGGALVMNAGTHEGCIADVLVWVEVLNGLGDRLRIPRSELAAGYRSMGLDKDCIVLGACFDLEAAPGTALKTRLSAKMRRRKATQPLGRPSAGCVFKNPPSVAAGELIERMGLKGYRIGDAEVSEKHANWIINKGNARAGDILKLIELIEKRAFEEYGVRLEREIKVLRP